MKPSIPFQILLASAVLWTLGTGGPATAKIVPGYDARAEHTWPRAPIAVDQAWWSAGLESGGGTARLRAEVGKKGDLSILVRGGITDGQPTSGYLVRLEGTHLRLDRVDGDALVPLAEPERARLPSRGAIELLVTHTGPYVVARLYRARSAQHLASIFVRDGTYAAGDVAVRVGGGNRRERDTLERFSTREACTRTPNPTKERGRAVWATLLESEAQKLEGVKLSEIEPAMGAGKVYRFDTLDLERAVCQGVALEGVSLETPWRYVDASYRATSRRGLAAENGRVDLAQSYKNPAMVQKLLEDWARRFPERTHLETLGQSHEGRPILALAIGAHAGPAGGVPTLLLNGGHHGNEPLSVDFVLDAAAEMIHAPADSEVARWLGERTVWVVPVVNPDGLHAFLDVSSRTGRKNGHDHDGDGIRERLEGVDLNRGYPFQWGALGERGSRSRPSSVYYRGEAAGAEPEVAAMMALARREGFAASISYHTGTVAVLAPYTIPGVKNPKVNEAWAVARELVRAMPRHAQDRRFEVKKNLYPVDGTDQDWHRFAHGTVALLVEGARSSPTRPRTRRRILESVAPAWRFLLERFTAGRLLDIQVHDSAGRPVRAEVRVREMAPRSGERWWTRCPAGRVLRAVPRAGTWTVEVRVEGRDPVRRRVKVGAGPTQVVVELPEGEGLQTCGVAP